jgi:hypothetical protein
MGIREKLEQKRLQLAAQLAKIDAKLAVPSPAMRRKGPAIGRRPLRNLVLDCLQDMQVMTYSQQLAIYAKARCGREIPSVRFGTLSRDEERAARGSRPREVWLCHGLTFDRGEPIRRLWARSDWPLHDRIVAPTTSRVLYLRTTARLAELAMRDQAIATDPDMLKYLAADNARDLGLPFKRGEFPLDTWREYALAQLQSIEEEDRQARMEAAKRIASLPLFAQLFGRASTPVVLPGGASRREEA